MEKLIEIQAVVNKIEDLTLDPKYHSKFNYLDDKRMQLETYCWKQASSYKDIFDSMMDIVVYIINNSTIEIWQLK